MTHRFLIHIGYPKSGSTTLHEGLFMRHDDANYIYGYSRGSENTHKIHDLFKAIRRGSDIPFADLWQQIALPQLREDKLNIFAEEGMTFGDRPFSDVIADITEVMPQAQVLIVVRPQIDLLRSYYDMYSFLPWDTAKKTLTFSDWLRGMLESPEGMRASLRFVDVTADCQAAYGARNVMVVSMARLFKEPQMRRTLFDRLGLDPEAAEALFGGRQRNAAADHAGARLGRRLLGPVRASQFLSYNQILWFKARLDRFTRQRKTLISDADRRFVAAHFAGQEIADLRRLDGEGAFL